MYNCMMYIPHEMENGQIIKFSREFWIGNDLWRETRYHGYFCTMDGKVAQMEFTEEGYLKRFLLMNIEVTNNGYQRVEIYFQKATRSGIPARKGHISIHRLVFETWCGFYLNDGLVIDHKDNNPSNNYYTNLQQVTQSYNISKAINNGRFSQCKSNTSKIRVYDEETSQTTYYDSIKEFLVAINAPEYMIKYGAISSLRKRREYNRYKIYKLEES